MDKNWLTKYPQVAMLLQQADDTLGYLPDGKMSILPSDNYHPQVMVISFSYRGTFRHAKPTPLLAHVGCTFGDCLAEVVICDSRAPQPVCSCGMYALGWEMEVLHYDAFPCAATGNEIMEADSFV